MQFAGMNGAECLQYGGAKCITYSCVCPKSGTIFRLQVPLAARRIKSTEVQECQFSFDYAVPGGVAFPDDQYVIFGALDVPRGEGVLRAVFPELDLLES